MVHFDIVLLLVACLLCFGLLLKKSLVRLKDARVSYPDVINRIALVVSPAIPKFHLTTKSNPDSFARHINHKLGVDFLTEIQTVPLPIAALLCVLWGWTGMVYHWLFFTSINKAAYLFSLLCIIQAVFFLLSGVIGRELHFQARLNSAGVIGTLLIIYALAVYPALGFVFGHMYPRSPTFGTPCPTTIFTFGLLLWTDRMPLHLVAIPFVWAMIGTTAIISLGMWEDMGLFVSGLLATALLTLRHQSRYNKRALLLRS